MVTQLTSIAISFLILIQSFGISIGEIIELDELIEHAQFHAEEHGDDFMVFLSKHYGELKAEHSQKHQEEQKDHEELPFNHQIHTASLSVFVLNDTPFYTDVTEYLIQHTTNYFYWASYPSMEKEGLFQPPRLA